MGKQKLLIIGHTWPEPKATAAGVRMMQLINYFKETNWDITFASTSTQSDKSADLQALGIGFQPIQVNDDQFDVFLLKLQPGMVLFDRYITEEQFGWRVSETLPDCIRVLDTEDLHSLRLARKNAVKNNKAFTINDWSGLDQTKRELASIYRSDLSLIISSHEMQLLTEELGVTPALLLYLPFWSNTDEESLKDNPEYSERAGFIFIGNGKHQPNIDAIEYLNKDIWPGIRELLPSAIINIYGAYLPDNIRSLHNPKVGFHINGFVDDAEEAMQRAKINLTPLRYGAGLKGKLLMALEQGTPSVCTDIAAEGIFHHNFSDRHSFDEPGEFIKEAVRLYTDEEAWNLKQQDGYHILEAGFNGDHYKGLLTKSLKNLGDNLEEHRSKNFVGSMLQHHSMQSTKYLSKWITLKNQQKT